MQTQTRIIPLPRSATVLICALACIFLAAPLATLSTLPVQSPYSSPHAVVPDVKSGSSFPGTVKAQTNKPNRSLLADPVARLFSHYFKPGAATRLDMILGPPSVIGLSPSSAIVGGPGFTLTVNGTGFISGFVIRINGADRTTTFVDPTQLTTPIAASEIAATGTFTVTVFDPDPSGGESAPLTFSINNPVPLTTSLSPASAPAGGAPFTLTITGANFISGATVNFGGTTHTADVVVIDSAHVSANIAASEIATGSAIPVTVTNPAPGGGPSTPALTFAATNPLPTASALSPTSATAGGAAFTLTITGTNFVSGTIVNFGGLGHPATLVDATHVSASIAASEIAAGATKSVTVTNAAPGGGTSTPALSFTVNNLVPTVTSLSPTTKFAGDTAFTLTINGTNFNSSSIVRFNGNARTTTLVSVTQLTAQILATDIAAVGTFPITVLNPAPAGGTSNAVNLTVSNAPVPTLTSISPTSVSAGGLSFTLTVNGTNFFGASVVRFNGSNRATTFVSSTQLTAAITAADVANAGAFPMTVFNPAPGGGTSAAVNLTVNPTITSLSPTIVRVGGGGFTVTVNGTGFVSGSKVRWNGSNKSTTFVSATKLTASISSSDIASVGIFPITVLNPSPTNLTSNAISVTVTPSVTNLTPLTAVAGDPAFTLTVTGAGFVSGATVNWNGVSRPTTFVNATKLTALIPATDIAAVGSFPITVLNPAPTSLLSNPLNFNVTDATPASECPAVSNSTLANPGLINFGSEKSQMWRNDNIWWGAFSNNTDGIYFYKQTGNAFTQGALIDTNIVAGTFIAGTPDCLWNGTNLFIVVQESTILARLYKYTYSSVTQTYTLISGFPLNLPLTGAGTNTSGKFGVISLDQDSTGKVWAAYAGSGVGGDGNVHVIYSTSADHKIWNTTGFVLATGVSTSTQEAAPIIRFGANKVGVVWTNQVASEDAFRYHIDGDLETVWSAKETIDSGLGPQGLGSVAENHMSLKAAPDGRLFLVAKDNDGNGHLHLYIRSAAGLWGQKTLVINDFNANPTRPVLLLDTDNSEVHVIYKDASALGTSRTFITQSFMDKPAFNTPCAFIDTSQSTQTSSNPTSTKQNVNATTDLIVAASTGKKGNTILFNTIDITPPQVTVFSVSPKEVTAGESAASLTLTVNGKLFVRTPSPGSIVRFNGVDRTTTYFNAGRLTAPIPGADLASPGVFPVAVINPDSAVSNNVNFTITATNPLPTVSAISPNREPIGSTQFTITVTGTGFRRTSIVQFNGNNRATTFVNDTQLTATILASDLLASGPYPITVFNPAPGGGTSIITKVSTFFVQPPCPASSPQTLSGITVFNTVKAQMWRNDSLWWGAFSDNAGGIYFYKQSGSSFTKGALIDANFNGRPDVKWNGTNLFILIYELNTQAKLYKYSYSTTTKVFTLLTGFPVSLPLIGVGTGPSPFQIGSITLDQDNTGKLWAAYPGTGPGGDGNYRVIWSTSADHKVWDTNGFVIASGGSTIGQEVSPIIHFGGNKIGVAWSNQVAKEMGFRYHSDGDVETNWSTKELIDFGLGNEIGIGGVADNHMSIKAAPDGRLFLVAKDSDGVGYVHLYIRSAAGVWTDSPILVDIDPQAQTTRPNLLLDLANSDLYVIYEDATAQLAYLSHTSMDVPVFGPACPYVTQNSIGNITSTKQNLNVTTGLMAAGSTGGASSQININPVTITQGTGNPLPVLSSISPSAVGTGGGPFTLTLNGSSFVNGAVVYFNGSDRATTFVSNTRLTATILSTDIAANGTFPITVMNPRGGTSAAVINLTVNPVISGFSPASATTGDPAFTLTVNGTGFVSGAVVQWNGLARTTTFVSATQLTAQILAADVGVAATIPITVVNPTGGGTSAPRNFTVNNPVPTVTTISPNRQPLASAQFTLTVTGTKFVNGSIVRWNGSDRVTTFVSGTQLTATIPASDLLLAGSYPITVFSPAPGGGTSAVTKASTFYVQPACTTTSPQSLPGITAFNTVKAQMWFNDNNWWGAFSDNLGGVYFYKQSGGGFTQGALIDTAVNGRPDTLWNGNDLFILIFKSGTQATLYKYSYDAISQTHALISGFPINLTLNGNASSITLDQDSTGKLWAAYTGSVDGQVHVIWSTSSDHTGWDTTGFVLGSGVSSAAQEVAPVIHFGNGKTGVAWSNQVTKEIDFRYHSDGDVETSWGSKEIIDFGLGNEIGTGGVADGHMSMKAAPDGRIFLVAKDSDGVGYVHLYIRSTAGVWTDPPILVDLDPQAQTARPNLLLDLENSELYIIYEDAAASLMYLSHASMDVPVFSAACPYVTQTSIANVTSTKQNLNAITGLRAAGSTGGVSSQIYVNPVSLAHASGNAPALNTISPSAVGVATGPLTLTINGSNFVSNSVVYFNGYDRPTTFVSATQLTARIFASDLATLGTYPITVMNPRGGTSAAVNLVVNPNITTLSPASATAGDPNFTLTVNGTGFISGAVVKFNGVSRTTTFVNSTQLTAQILATDVATAGLPPVTVTNPGASGGTSAASTFTVNNPAPTVTSVAPTSVIVGGSAFTLTVNGTNFNSSSIVQWNGLSRATTFVNSTQLTAPILVGDIATTGSFPVTVFMPAPGGGTSLPASLAVVNPLPTLNSVAPANTIAGGSGFTLAVTGTNFVNGAVVRFNGLDRATTFVDGTTLTAQILNTDIAAAGSFPIIVFNPLPGGGSSGAVNFIVNNPLPTLTNIVPTSKTAGDAAFILTVNGTNLVASSVVLWNGLSRTTNFVNGTQITAQITAADVSAAGTASLTVSSPAPGGGTSNANTLTINNPVPTLISIAPTSKIAGDAAFVLTVNGTNFNSSSIVRFNGSDRVTTSVNATQLTAQITAADIQAGGIFPITVANPGGGTSGAVGFTVNNPTPAVSTLSPANVTLGGPGFLLSVNGSNFVNGSVVRFGGTDRPTTFVSSTQLAAQIAAADIAVAGTFPITVFNPAPGGGVSASLGFPVNNPAPTLNSIVPAAVTSGGAAFTLTVNGGNFVNGSVVQFNGSGRATTFVNSTQLTAQITAADITTAGTAAVNVFNPAPGGGPSSSLGLQVNNPAPTLTTISPAGVSAGGAAFILSVNGSNFVNGAVVRFNGNDRTTTSVNGAQLTAQITAADIQSTGTFPITVFNPTPGGGSSSAINLAVNTPAPTLGTISPTNKTAGDIAFTLAVNGTNFVNGSVVRWNGSDRVTTFVSGTQLTSQITAADISVAGTASVVVFNPAPGGGTSNAATFTINSPHQVRMNNSSAASGSTVNIPIELEAQGNENALGFSVSFDQSLLSNPQAALGSDAIGATLNTNTTQLAQGRFGIALSLPSGQTFAVGTRQIVVLTFRLASVGTQTSTPVNFANQPIALEVVDPNAISLVSAFTPGTIIITLGYEADVAPRGSGGNNSVTVSDWVQIGRFTSGLDTINPGSEFQKADCAPKASLGNGSITVSDWVQAGRYASGLDPVMSAGGPTQPPAGLTTGQAFTAESSGAPNTKEESVKVVGGREVRIMDAALLTQTRTISVVLEADGIENAVGFSLMFDPAKLHFISSSKGLDAQSATLQVNSLSAARGHVGIVLALPAGQSFDPGTRQLVTLTFDTADALGESTQIGFDDQPVKRELVDVFANAITAAFKDLSAVGRNPLDDTQFFVRQQYLDFLNRTPDAEGLDYWINEIVRCAGSEPCIRQRRIDVSAAFFAAPEFQQTGYLAFRLYRAAYGRRPTFVEFLSDRNQLVAGPQLPASIVDFANQFVARAEFKQAFPDSLSSELFVNRLFDTAGLLGNTTERRQEIQFLANNSKSRAQVLLDVIEIKEFSDREYNSAFVLMQYFGYLRRDADEGGYQFWLNVLNSREPGNYRGMVCSFVTAREYQERFGSVVTHSNSECPQ